MRVVMMLGGADGGDGVRRCTEHVSRMEMTDGRTPSTNPRKFAAQRCARECPSRQAEHQQNDSKEFAPVCHEARV